MFVGYDEFFDEDLAVLADLSALVERPPDPRVAERAATGWRRTCATTATARPRCSRTAMSTPTPARSTC